MSLLSKDCATALLLVVLVAADVDVRGDGRIHHYREVDALRVLDDWLGTATCVTWLMR